MSFYSTPSFRVTVTDSLLPSVYWTLEIMGRAPSTIPLHGACNKKITWALGLDKTPYATHK